MTGVRFFPLNFRKGRGCLSMNKAASLASVVPNRSQEHTNNNNP